MGDRPRYVVTDGTRRRGAAVNFRRAPILYFGKGKRVSFNKRVRNVINKTTETKKIDWFHNATDAGSRGLSSAAAEPVTTTVKTWELTDIAVGDGMSRDGNELYLRSIGGRFSIENNAAGPACQYIRFVLYRPKNVDSLLTTLTYKSIIDDDAYDVYFDKLIAVDAEHDCKIVKLGKRFWNKVIPGLKVEYLTNTTGDIIKNAVCLAIVSNEATNAPTIEGYLRVFFKDK